jgi:energy-coupling factor transport system substrate-specific component
MKNRENTSLKLKEMILFAMLAALMFCSKKVMEGLPNIHLVGMFIMTFTVVFRKKALIPLYIYVMLDGLFGGFGTWWIPYLYIWTILWGATMLLPQKMPRVAKCIVYPIVCCLHGLLFGILYSPVQAIVFHLNFEQTLVWIASGFPYDVLHAAGNLVFGMFIVPFSELFEKLLRKQRSL